jgi:Flp pilus assembly pilin Flp
LGRHSGIVQLQPANCGREPIGGPATATRHFGARKERDTLEVIARTLAVLRDDRRGVTAVEYTIIAALIIGLLAADFTTLGGNLNTTLTSLIGDI